MPASQPKLVQGTLQLRATACQLKGKHDGLVRIKAHLATLLCIVVADMNRMTLVDLSATKTLFTRQRRRPQQEDLPTDILCSRHPTLPGQHSGKLVPLPLPRGHLNPVLRLLHRFSFRHTSLKVGLQTSDGRTATAESGHQAPIAYFSSLMLFRYFSRQSWWYTAAVDGHCANVQSKALSSWASGSQPLPQ